MPKARNRQSLVPAFLVAVVAVFAVLLVVAMFFGGEEGLLHDREARELLHAEEKQPMEVGGRWLGMTLVEADSRTAIRHGVSTTTRGVAVLEISERDGWRALRAGVLPVDVIIGVEGHRVRSMEGFYDATLKVDIAQAVLLDVERGGLEMTLVLPAPDAWSSTADTASSTGSETGRSTGSNVQTVGPYYRCPNHASRLHRAAVHPYYRCPLCNGPLSQVP